MTDLKLLHNPTGYGEVFDDQYQAAYEFACRLGKLDELLVGLTANRALRAMLENENRIGL